MTRIWKAIMPKRFEIKANMHALQWDTDYGCEDRSGWTLVVHGRVVVELTGLFTCIKAWFGKGRRIRKWVRKNE